MIPEKPQEKKKSNVTSFILAGIVLALVGANIWWVVSRDGVQIFAEGEPAPNFTLPVVNPLAGMGGELELSSLKGKVVLLDFWGTWCPNCKKELPRIERLHKAADKDKFVVLGVANEQVDSASEAREQVVSYLDSESLTLPVVIDDGSVFNAYKVDQVPRMILLDRQGVVAKVYRNHVSPVELQNEISGLLE